MNKYKLVNFVGGFVFVGVCFYSVTNLVNLEKYSENTIDNNYNLLHNSEYDINHYKSISPTLPYESTEKIIKEGEELQRKKEWEERMLKVKLEKEILAELERQRLARIEEKKKQQKQIVVSRGSESSVGDWVVFEASYYTSSCYQCSGISASGVDLRNSIYYKGLRIIATDPKIIPLWSIVEVKTHYGTFKAISLDTGGRIKQFHADILVSTKEEAYQLGRHNVQIRVLKYPESN